MDNIAFAWEVTAWYLFYRLLRLGLVFDMVSSDIFNKTVPGADFGDCNRKALVKEDRQDKFATTEKIASEGWVLWYFSSDLSWSEAV